MSNITTEWVNWQVTVGRTDGADADTEPDDIPAQGTVKFVASVPYLTVPGGAPNPVTFLPEDRVAVFDGAGYLSTPLDGEPTVAAYPGMRLEISDDPDVSTQDWTWTAYPTITNSSKKIAPFSFVLVDGAPLDLANVVKVPASPGLGTEQAEALTAAAQYSAAQSAQDAADAAQSAADAAGAAAVTDANISALIANPATDTAQATQALVDDAAASKLEADDAAATYQQISTLDAALAVRVSTDGTSTQAAVQSIADTAAADAASGKLDASQKGAASGVATLDSGTKVPLAQVPDLTSRHVTYWIPSTVYAAGQTVISPNGDLVSAKAAHTSGATFTAANWNLSATFVQWVAGHIGIEKTNPVNARLYIGSGTGSLTDNGNMGVKVKIDTEAGARNDGIQSNVNVLSTAGAGTVRGILGRVDVNDTGNTGDTVALWGDVFTNTASSRNTWGANIYNVINAGSGYLGSGMGAEIGLFNYDSTPQSGGILHLVSWATNTVRFALKCGGTAGSTYNVEHSILMSSTTPPAVNAFYYGPLAAGNQPTGTPLVQINAAGRVGLGAAPDSTALLKVAGRAIVGTGTEAGDAVNKAQLDAAATRYSPAGALATTMDRRTVASAALPALTSGTLRLSAVWLPKGTVVTSATYVAGTAATSLTNRWFSLFDASRNLLKTTADNTASWSAGAALTIPFASTYTVPSDGLYYVGICEVATTPTALRGMGGSSNTLGLAPILNGDSSTGLTNAASTPATAAAITASGSLPFAYVS